MIKSDVVKAMEMEREMLVLEKEVAKHLKYGRYNLASEKLERAREIRFDYQDLVKVPWTKVRRKIYNKH